MTRIGRGIGALGILAGCAPSAPDPTFLDGSFPGAYASRFDGVRARAYRGELAIEYVDTARQGLVVLRLAVPASRDVRPGDVWDLAVGAHLGVGQDLATSVPELASGRLVVDAVHADRIAGAFDAVLAPRDGVALTLQGGFDAPLERVDAW